jgi:hypothetical protein
MSAIKIAGTYVDYVPSGTPLGNVSLDVTGKSHFTSDIQIDGNLILLSDVSLNNRLFINGDVSMNSKLTVIGDASFNNIFSSVVPISGNMLCNKTYVDSVGGSSILATNNIFTGINTFSNTIIGSGDVSMNSRLFVNGDVSLNSKLSVVGDVSMNSRLFVNGDVSLNSKLSVVGDASFNNIFSSVVPISGNMLCNKTYVDAAVSGAGGVSLSSNNVWTGTNAFNTSLPTSTLTPSTSTELTTKAYVDSNFVDLLNNQTIAGEKIFTDQTEIGPGTLITVDINTSGLIDVQDVYINGLLNIGSTTIKETGVGDISLNNPVNGGKYIFNADDTFGVSKVALNLSASTATFNGDIFASNAEVSGLTVSYISNTSSIDTPSVTSGLGSDNLNVGANQTSGNLFLGCRTNRTGEINIGTLATGNAPIVIGSTSSTTQTATHNAISTFNKIPLCAGVPSTGDHLTNKTYVDGNFCALTGTQTIAGLKTFSNIASCSVAPTVGSHLCNKTYVDSVAGGGGVSLSGNNVWTGTNTFNTNLPTSTQTPSSATQLTTKTYVDSNFCNLSGTQTVGGVKTFTGNNIHSGTNSFGSTTSINTIGGNTTSIGNITASVPTVEIFGNVQINTGGTNVRSTAIGNATGTTTVTGQLTCVGNTQFGDAAADFIVPNGTLTKPFIIGTYASQSSFSLASITQVTTYLGGTLQTSASFGNSASGTFRYVMASVSPYNASGGLALTAGTYMMWIALNFEDASAFQITDLRMGLSTLSTLTAASTEATITGSLPNLTCYFHRTDPTDAATSDSDNIVLSSCFNIASNTTLYPFYVANHSVVMDLVKCDVVFTKIGGP